MTTPFDYFERVFPAALVHRLFCGVGRARHVVVSREPDFYKHFAATTFSSPADLVGLIQYWHTADETGAHKLTLPRALWQCTTLHLGWILAERHPLPPRGDKLDNYQFEIAFDLDLPTFDEREHQKIFPIRDGFLCDCASTHAGCCRSCWLLVRLARAALTHLVPPEWGPGLWIYSGGKGAHCLYGSEAARSFPKEMRKKFAVSLLDAAEGRETVSPALVAVLKQVWETAGVRELKVLARDNACHILANAYLVPNSPAHTKFLAAVEKTPDSALRWAAFVRFGNADVVQKVVCAMGLPRLDTNPLSQTRARIKSPFSLHMTSRRVALPLPDTAFESFDPRNAPSLNMEPDALRTNLQASRVYLEEWLNTNKYDTG